MDIFRQLRECFSWQMTTYQLLIRIGREVLKIVATLQELKDKLVGLTSKVAELKTSVDNDVAQVGVLVTEVRELIEAIKASGNTDFAEQIAAVDAAISGVEEARTKLASDNADIDAAIAESNAQVPPANP